MCDRYSTAQLGFLSALETEGNFHRCSGTQDKSHLYPAKVPTGWKFYRVGVGMSQTPGPVTSRGTTSRKTRKGFSGLESGGDYQERGLLQENLPQTTLSSIQYVAPVPKITCLPFNSAQHSEFPTLCICDSLRSHTGCL